MTSVVQVDKWQSGDGKLEYRGAVAWLNYLWPTATGSVIKQMNIASVTRTGLGVYKTVFTTPLPTDNYTVIHSTTGYGAAGGAAVAVAHNRAGPQDAAQTTTGFTTTYGVYDNTALVDPRMLAFAVFN